MTRRIDWSVVKVNTLEDGGVIHNIEPEVNCIRCLSCHLDWGLTRYRVRNEVEHFIAIHGAVIRIQQKRLVTASHLEESWANIHGKHKSLRWRCIPRWRCHPRVGYKCVIQVPTGQELGNTDSTFEFAEFLSSQRPIVVHRASIDCTAVIAGELFGCVSIMSLFIDMVKQEECLAQRQLTYTTVLFH